MWAKTACSCCGGIMTGDIWTGDVFAAELTAKLVATLTGAIDESVLAQAVADCAAAADAVCYDRQLACTAGCPHCCVLNVSILFPEGMVIADWVKQNFSPNALAAMRESLVAHNSRGRWMDDEERITRRAFCPFLDNAGKCSIHVVRPLACRGVSSLDRNGCREAFNPIISDQERSVHTDLLRRAAFDEAFKALAQTLRHYGLDDRSIEVGTGVLVFLTRPEYFKLFLTGRRLPRELWD